MPSLVLVALFAFVAAGCGAARQTQSLSTATTGARSSTTPTPTVSNPLTIVGRISATSLGLRNPRSFAIGPDGNLYITDNSNRVTVVSRAGKVLRRWGGPGDGPGQFSFVSIDPSDPSDVHASIAVGADGKVYVSDSGNYRIEVFSSTGTFIRQFGSFGNGNGRFLAPFVIAVDRSGNLYVADDQKETLSKFSPTGRFE